MKIGLAGFFCLFQSGFGALRQCARVLAVQRIMRETRLERRAYRASFDVEHIAENGAVEQRGDIVGGNFRLRWNHHEGPPTEVPDALVVIDMVSEALRHPLQQQVANMTAEAVVDVAEIHDIEGDYRRCRFGPDPTLQKLVQALAEESALCQTREWIVVGEILDRVLFLSILKSKGQIGDHVLKETQLLITQQVPLTRRQ